MKRTKKIIILFMLVLFFMKSYNYAITCDTLNIEIPSSFEKISDYFYSKDNNSYSINITYTKDNISEIESNIYTYDNLKMLAEEFNKQDLSEHKDNIKENVEKIYNELDNEQFNTLYNSMNYSLDSYEIVTIGKDNYKAFKFELSAEVLNYKIYQELYTIVTKTGSYHISIDALDKSYFESSEYLEMLNSVEVSNYLSRSYIEAHFAELIFAIIFFAFVIFGYINKSKSQKKSKKQENDDSYKKTEYLISKISNQTIECKVCGKKINYNENGTCEECHQKILKRIAEKNDSNNSNKQEFEKDEILDKMEIINKSSLSDNAKNKLKTQINSISKKDIEDIIKLSENNKGEKRFCTNCGKELKPEWKFCNYCGHKND